MPKDLLILVLVGTTRVQRKSRMVAEYVAEIGKKIEGVDIKIVDPDDLELPGDGNDPEAKDSRYTKLTGNADAFFVTVPEYNHSFPGSLKRMLDSELKNYIHKPIAMAGVSSGMWGGVRAVESMLSPIRAMGLVGTYSDVYFQNSYDLFGKDGKMKEENRERYEKATRKAYDELIWMAKTLKQGRENN